MNRARRLLAALVLCVVQVVLGTRPASADSRTDARRYFQQGMALIEEGKPLEGIELLKKAHAIRPHPSVLFNIARAYTSIGRNEDAIEYFQRYLDSNPSDADEVRTMISELSERRGLRALVDEGMAAIADRRYAEGIALLRRAYEARPHPNILYNIARAYEDAGDARRAIATYERYLKTDPKDEDEVRASIRRLRNALPKRSTERSEPRANAERPKRSTSEKGKKTPEPEPTPPPAEDTAELEEQRMERLAQMVADLIRRDAEAKERAPVPAEAPASEVELSGDPGSGPSAPSATATPEVTTTTVPASLVDIAAKSGEAYEEVVFTASRREQSPLDAPNAVTIITEEDIRLSGARNIPDLLRRVPGMEVMAMSYSDYNVAMRGFNRRVANKILVLIDGRTVYEDYLGGMLWRAQTLDMFDIARIEVVRGPGSAIYGAYAYTGMVNIITKRPEDIGGSVATVAAGNGKTLEATYQYGQRQGALGLRSSIGFARGNKYELEFDPSRVDFTSGVDDPTKSLDEIRADATADFLFPKEGGRLFVGGGVRSGFAELYGVAAVRNQAIEGTSFNVRGGYTGSLFSFLAFWNAQRSDSTPQFFPTGLDDRGSNVDGDTLSVEPIFRPTFSLAGEHQLVLGGEYRHKSIRWDYLDGPQDEDHFAAFAQDSWAINPLVQVIASARLDLHPIIGPLGSPRLAVIVKPTPRQAIRASIGTAFRAPTLAETYLQLSAPTPVAGVAVTLVGGHQELEPENIATLDVGYKVQPDFGEFEAVGYVNRVGNLITRTPLSPTDPGAELDPDLGAFVGFVSNYVNDPRKFIALGTELSMRLYPVEGLDLGASYALQYIFDEDTGDQFTDYPQHKATAWGQLRTAFGMDLGFSAHFVSAQQWVEPNYDPSAPTGFDTTRLPVDAALVLIGRMGYRAFDDKLELAISGTNLADFGSNRHREHPYANRVEARVLGSVTARF